ncbi:hypothetical protein [Terasakiella sp. SH-1]|uniref:hypothetical protein n=1 Tax=Terasakiella sp. SH-1 TaxID=2560057 RepID=UPI001073199A|nr:hypothetical protein [Terasakiella sp. SH-1]
MERQSEIGQHLKQSIQDIFDSCPNPNKGQKCLDYSNPDDVPCDCKHIRAARQQLMFIEKSLRK